MGNPSHPCPWRGSGMVTPRAPPLSSRSCRRGLGSAGRKSCPTLPGGGCPGEGDQACALPVRPFAGTMQPFRRAGRAALDPETPALMATCRTSRGRRAPPTARRPYRTDPPHQVLGAAGADGHLQDVSRSTGSTSCSPAVPDGSAAPGARRSHLAVWGRARNRVSDPEGARASRTKFDVGLVPRRAWLSRGHRKGPRVRAWGTTRR